MASQPKSAAPSPDCKQLARHIFQQTLAAIDIPATMLDKLERDGSRITSDVPGLDININLADYRDVFAVAVGKASTAMARGLNELLGPGVCRQGIMVAPADALADVPGFRAIAAGHPWPDSGSVRAAREILELLARCDEHTLVFFLLSGGGSSLMELPLDSAVTLSDVQSLYRLLVHCGAPIEEINAIRKHLSAVKGGRLAAAAPSSMKITLGITDVPAGHESALGSGPTIPDPTTVADACSVLERYDLLPKLPQVFRQKFLRPSEIPETLKPGDPAFSCGSFGMLLDMHDLFHHAHQCAQACGCATVCDDATDGWPLGKAADYLIAQLTAWHAANPGRRVALISDGEVSSPVKGTGVGGRNTAFVLECVPKIAGTKITVLSAGTDGRDGSSPAAGAVADGETLARAQAAGLDWRDFERRSDSYNFFRELGDAVETGPTGNNLRDLRVFLME
jgi:glycerate 2-kinase